MFSLDLLTGPSQGQSLQCGQHTVTLGSGRGCTIVIDQPGVNGVHAVIDMEEGPRVSQYFIQDRNPSLNGTFVNGRRIGSRTALNDGDRIKICEFVCRFRLGVPLSAGAMGTLAQTHPAKAGILKLAEYLRSKLTEKPTITFLLVGRTGAGKSSTINTLFGCEVAKTARFRPQTMDVQEYQHNHDGVNYVIVDTPGLCDALPHAGNDQQYLQLIKSRVKQIDSLWYVLRLDDNRVDASEQRGIQLVSEAFGPQVWARSLVIFTHADRLTADEYEEALQGRTQVVHEEIGKYAHWHADTIPVVAVSNRTQTTPDGKRWLEELFTVVTTRFSEAGMAPFLLSMKEDLKPTSREPDGQPSKPRIELSAEQKHRIGDRLMDRVAKGAQVGREIGKPWGPVGEVFGAVLGGTAGALLSWLYE